ncbi:MAG: DUF438 domain-containing protein [Candidatus Natronoplasma sp.]
MGEKELTKVLKRLAEGNISEERVLEEIKKASPSEISKAEQNLLEGGIRETELQQFCKVHLKAIDEKVIEMRDSLKERHPLRTLVLEHEEILRFLDQLEEFKKGWGDRLTEEKKKELERVARHLVETEKHHEREEKTIFPRMRDNGVTGPPRIMELEHDDLRPKKKKLLELSKEPEKNKERIIELIDYIGLNLRDHIFKENNILYPSALEELENWDLIEKECDDIGYCCFTP